MEALHEEHRRGHAGHRHLGRVVQRPGWQPVRPAAGFADGFVGEGHELGMEWRRVDVPEPLPRHRHVALRREAVGRRPGLGVHLREGGRVEVPAVQRDPALLDDARHDARPRRAGADRAHAPAAAGGDRIDLLAHLRGGEEGVVAAVHGGRARVGGLPAKRDRVPLHAERAEHGAEREAEVEEDGALLDVELEVGGGGAQFAVALLHPFEIDPDFTKRVGEAHALFVDEPPRLVEVEAARAGGRPEQALAEPRAFLVGPVHDAQRDRWPARMLGGHAPQHLHAGQQAEAAVEPAAVGHRVDVAADHDGAGACARERRPHVARGVGVGLDRQAGEPLAKPGPGPLPRGGEGQPLRAVRIA